MGVVGTCDYSIWGVEAGRQGIQGHSQLPRELEASELLPEDCLKESKQDSKVPTVVLPGGLSLVLGTYLSALRPCIMAFVNITFI